MIYREGGRRYIPIKFSVRGRDLQSTIEELKDILAHQVKLPSGYTYTWAGEYDSLQKELHRLGSSYPSRCSSCCCCYTCCSNPSATR